MAFLIEKFIVHNFWYKSSLIFFSVFLTSYKSKLAFFSFNTLVDRNYAFNQTALRSAFSTLEVQYELHLCLYHSPTPIVSMGCQPQAAKFSIFGGDGVSVFFLGIGIFNAIVLVSQIDRWVFFFFKFIFNFNVFFLFCWGNPKKKKSAPLFDR